MVKGVYVIVQDERSEYSRAATLNDLKEIINLLTFQDSYGKPGTFTGVGSHVPDMTMGDD